MASVPRPKRVLRGVLLVLLGAALGLPAGWIASVFLPVQGRRYVLTRKLDTAEADPFESGVPACVPT